MKQGFLTSYNVGDDVYGFYVVATSLEQAKVIVGERGLVKILTVDYRTLKQYLITQVFLILNFYSDSRSVTYIIGFVFYSA